ncbi:hypothetical protein [Amphritea japonica]|uniref:Uncharacterized protein n=1 Tax=Amphritea japonica ATCC BAA-1530 TaxID=1278309 RepID=A0A7R6SSU4_9GAMM|nr:hypothetical protein [Amphritea japonica]BBB25952.1 conserved hypothetical protein [Amphritea japonica ATCC BAA-1530]
MKKNTCVFALLLLSSLLNGADAGEANVVNATVSKTGAGLYSFSVTVQHEDSGWDHYANQWEVVDPQGKVLGTRILVHPHVREQPFTRSLSGVRIGAGVKSVTIRAQDLVHGYGGTSFTLNLPD